MLRNILIVSFRNLKRNANYTVLNALGLSIGIAACIVIFLVVDGELSYDKFHSKYDRTYRVTSVSESADGTGYSAMVSYPFGRAFREDFSDIPLTTNVHFHEEAQMSFGSERQSLTNILFADSLFFDVFDFGVISGNTRKELSQPGKAFLTKSLADRLGNVQTIKLDNKLELEVVGIVNDPPANSHITYTMVVSLPSLTEKFLGLPIDQWGMKVAGYSYVVLPETLSKATIEERMVAFEKKYHRPEDVDKDTYKLQPLADIHFNNLYPTNMMQKPDISFNNLVVLMMLGGFILLVACVNFVNLSTALAVKKSREIGVRKTLGAHRGQLTRQYLAEAFMITLLSAAIAMVITELSLGFISRFLERPIVFNPFSSAWILAFLAGLVMVTALLAGLYPALVLSRFNPVDVLKNKLHSQGSSGSLARRYLVVFQFVIAQLLIIGTLVVAHQMEYFRSKPLGFTTNAIINIPLPRNQESDRTALFAEWSAIAGVEAVSYSLGAPTSDGNLETSFFLTERGEASQYVGNIKTVDVNYMNTYGVELIAGRWFLPGEEKLTDFDVPDADRRYNCLVNESVVKKLGFASNEDIIGKKLSVRLNDIQAPVIGVVKNFHTASLHSEVQPVVLLHFPYFYRDAGIRLNDQSTAQTLEAVKEAFAKVFPDQLFAYTFIDQRLAKLYRQEEKAYSLIKVFASLSMAISCLGLLGLVSFLTQQKVKEVGIRKVFGASAYQILFLFSRNFVGLVLLASAFAVPFGWFAMNRWLEGFAYRTSMPLSVFWIAFVITLAMALITISFQSIRAALENPVKALRAD